MKSTVKKVSAIILTLIFFNSNAQIKVKPMTPRGGSNSDPSIQNNTSSQNNQSSGSANHWGGGSVTLAFGNYPPSGGYYGPNYYNGPAYYGGGYYNGYGSIKRSAKYALHASQDVINRSIDIHNWNDIYSPLLAKAIRHHNYAKQMYRWGNYNATINHAERARYLAWYSLQYFQNPNCYNGYGYNNGPGYNDPYGDPYDPYYRKGNTGNGEKTVPQVGNKKQALPEPNDIDDKLPQGNMNDKELIRSFDKSEEE